MSLELDFPLLAGAPTVDEARRRGFTSFLPFAEYIRRIPYGRPSDGQDVFAVLRERVGTCSSKHRLLATVAHDCGRSDVELMVGVYEMAENNTPGVGAVLKQAGLGFVPEAHCYLRFRGQRYDFTGLSGGRVSPLDAMLFECVVAPADLREVKARLHREAVQAWAAERSLSFVEVWAVREACIESLASGDAHPPAGR